MEVANPSQLNQWMKRHVVLAMRTFRRLEIHTARIRSSATAPSPTATRLYSEVIGTKIEMTPVGT